MPKRDNLEVPPNVAEAAASPVRLVENDLAWLERVSNGQVDEGILVMANEAIASDTTSLPKSTARKNTDAIRAREDFFGDILGWADTTHRLHKAYTGFRASKPWLVPIATFVGTQRVLTAAGGDTARIIKVFPSIMAMTSGLINDRLQKLENLGFDRARMITKFPAVLSIPPDTLSNKLNNLSEQGFDAHRVVRGLPQVLHFSEATIVERTRDLVDIFCPQTFMMVNLFPSLLSGNAAAIERRLSSLQQMLKVMGWKGEIWDVIRTKPVLLGLSRENCSVHAQLLADNLNVAALSPSEIGNLFVEPAENFLLSLAVDENPSFTARSVRAAAQGLTKEQKEVRVRQLLNDPAFRAKVGEQTLKAYQYYKMGVARAEEPAPEQPD